jgi:hypothetical protein
MEEAVTSTLGVLKYLLPGFLVAWVYFGLTAHYKPDKFERVIQALVFSIIVQAIAAVVRHALISFGRWFSFGAWNSDVQTIWSVIIAVLLGLFFSWCANTDRAHQFFRKFRVTKQTSYPSEWFGAFNDYERYVVLHLNGGRRLLGWPREWPNKSAEGHFLIVEAAWLLDDGGQADLTGNEGILVPASEVELIEFLRPNSMEVSSDQKATHA